jgi:hypothetical protein
VKIANKIDKEDLKGLRAFMKEHQSSKNYLVSLVLQTRKIHDEVGSIDILPYC